MLTVLGRLERKGLVTRERDGRAHRYRSVGSREDHVAELMNDALGTAADRGAALARFVGSIPPEERARLRDLLGWARSPAAARHTATAGRIPHALGPSVSWRSRRWGCSCSGWCSPNR